MMKSYKRILVALGLTDGRDAAFERALALAKTSGAALYLLPAIPHNRPFSHRSGERLQRAAELVERAKAQGVAAQAFEQHGDPAEIIVLHADARQVDAIVMGTERRTRWARFLQRSIAERVLRRTTRPTLVVRSDDTVDRSAFENVLVATELAPGSAALVDTALQVSAGARRLTLLHAVTGLEAEGAVRNRARWLVPEYRLYMLEDARRQLEDAMPAEVDTRVTFQLRAAAGPAAETIGAQAADLEADLVVMGRSRRWLHLGSTVARVLRDTDRSLLIVPPAAPAYRSEAGQDVHARAA
jgi:nucleotide-binding universal stress UspA family protein